MIHDIPLRPVRLRVGTQHLSCMDKCAESPSTHSTRSFTGELHKHPIAQ